MHDGEDDGEDEALAYGEELPVNERKLDDFDKDLIFASDIAEMSDSHHDLPSEDSDTEATVVGDNPRDLGAAIEAVVVEPKANLKYESEADSGTITDDYEADCSEAEIGNHDDTEDRDITRGMSELSLIDTLICV